MGQNRIDTLATLLRAYRSFMASNERYTPKDRLGNVSFFSKGAFLGDVMTRVTTCHDFKDMVF